MNDVCHGVKIIYSPYFFIGVPGAPREIIVGKNIYNFIFCESVSFFQLLIFEVGCLDLVYLGSVSSRVLISISFLISIFVHVYLHS